MPEMDPLKECSYLKATKKVKVHGPGKKKKATFLGLPWKFDILLYFTAFPLLPDISSARLFFCAIL